MVTFLIQQQQQQQQQQPTTTKRRQKKSVGLLRKTKCWDGERQVVETPPLPLRLSRSANAHFFVLYICKAIEN